MIRLIVAAIAFALMTGICMKSMFVHYKMLNQLNNLNPEDAKFDYFWWHPLKHMRFDSAYRKYFPDSDLWKLRRRLTVALVVSMAVFAVAFGFLPFWPIR